MKKDKESKIVVYVFAGRFQPPHRGHIGVYDNLCKNYGPEHVYFATSNKVDTTSPLTFKEKKDIATKFFNIPANKFVQCAVPYIPVEIMRRYKAHKVSLVLVLGKKDADRLTNGAVIKVIKNTNMVKNPATETTYVLYSPMFADSKSATSIRKYLTSKRSNAQKQSYFVKMFGQFDKELFNILTTR